MAERDTVRGSSSTLNASITEIMNFLKDDKRRPGGPRADLRDFLNRKLADLGEKWFREGVIHGHKVTVAQYAKEGKGRPQQPIIILADIEFFPNHYRQVRFRTPRYAPEKGSREGALAP